MTDSELLDKAYSAPEGSLGADGLDALRALRQKYPYFTAPAVALLRQLGADAAGEEADSLRRFIAVAAPSGRTLAFAAHGAEWRDFYPEAEEAEAKRTDDVIDVFLRTYGSTSPEEEALLERMIFNPTPDYSEMLAREEQENLPPQPDPGADSQDARIAAFILSQHPAVRHPEPEPEPQPQAERKPVGRPEPAEDSLLSESLALIFIKQHRYERAYEIISGLNLKFPKKSAYFADQLRFLQKLIINQRRLEAQKGGGTDKN